MDMQIELFLLVLSVLFLVSIMAGKISSKYGVPALLLFLIVGMLFGSDGWGIKFESIKSAHTVGTIALCIILFSGGLDTKIQEIKPIYVKGITLATLGVFLSAIIGGFCIWGLLQYDKDFIGFSLLLSLLLSSAMASTDSASVFSILRSRGLNLKNNLRPLLELESGSNDPVAYILVITLIDIIQADKTPRFESVFFLILLQLAIGAIIGYLVGKISIYVINRIKIGNDSLYPILVFTCCIFTFSLSFFLHGNSFLSVYIAGLVIGNSRFVHKRSSVNFFDGLAWMSQVFMFLTLGLLVNPHELIPYLFPGIIISIVLLFFVRPLSVLICLSPFFKMRIKEKLYISWVGLKGAVPIIFAIMILDADIPYARAIYNIVFLCTLISLLIQGTSLAMVAHWLGIAENETSIKKPENFDVDFSDDIKSITTEIEVTSDELKGGNRLMDIDFPEKTLVVLVKRNESYFVPKGNTILEPMDKLLIITDNADTLSQTMENIKNNK